MPQVIGKVNRTLPATNAESAQVQARAGRYGEMMALTIGGPLMAIADEGQYFKATNPTLGTGIAMGIQTSFSDTANVLAVLFNSDSAGGKRIYLDYLKLICTAAGSTSTAADLALKIDSINRYSSGGSAITPVNANMDSAAAAVGTLHFGAVTAAAASAARIVGRDRIKTQAAPCWTVGDEVFINFGSSGDATAGGPTNGAATLMIPIATGPIILGPGHSLVVHQWNTANATTPPSWEFEMAWYER